MQVERGIQQAILTHLQYLENQGTVCAARTAVYNGFIQVGRPGLGRKIITKFITGRDGWPDITAVIKGHFVALEVKTSTGVQSIDQKRIKAAVEQAGGLYWLIRSVDEFNDRYTSLAWKNEHHQPESRTNKNDVGSLRTIEPSELSRDLE